MKRDMSDLYDQLAATHVRLVRWYSPSAAAALEQLYPYGAHAVYYAALGVLSFKTRAERFNGIPSIDDSLTYLRDYPDAVPLFHKVIDGFVRDWSVARRA